MKVTWIIENYSKENSFKELTEAIEELGYPLIKINGDYKKEMLRPVKALHDENNHALPFETCVIANGTIKMCKLVKENLEENWGAKCYPITYSNWPKYKCSSYYSHFGPYLFNDKYCLMSLKELERQKFDIWAQYGKDALIFIRPDSGEKEFRAGLLDLLDLGKFMDNNEDLWHDLVLISTPKKILWEGRFVCSKHKEIIASSTYQFQGQVTQIPSVPNGAKEFCQEILNKVNYYPDSVFCLDLCQDSDKNFWLMEVTSFSSAGLYCCDKKATIRRVSEMAWEDFNDH
jgi:hypothetical protein